MWLVFGDLVAAIVAFGSGGCPGLVRACFGAAQAPGSLVTCQIFEELRPCAVCDAIYMNRTSIILNKGG